MNGAAPAMPNTSLPRTIGTLNILFGIGLLLCGAGCLRGAVGVLGDNTGLRVDPELTRQAAREMRRNFVEELRQKQEAASSPAERARLSAARTRLEERPDTVAERVDFRRVNRGTRLLAIYLWADVVTGPVLNLLMLIAGVGLVRLKAWGLRLGIWVAALKLLRQVALGVLLIGFALPAVNRAVDEFADTDFAEVTSAKMREDQRAKQGGLPGAEPVGMAPEDVVKIVQTGGYIWAAIYTCGALLYPLIALLVLTRPAAAAAVARAEAGDTDEPLPPE